MGNDFDVVGRISVDEGGSKGIFDGLNASLDGLGGLGEHVGHILETTLGVGIERLIEGAKDMAAEFVKSSIAGTLAFEQLQVQVSRLATSTGISMDTVNQLSEKFRDLAGGSDETVLSVEKMAMQMGTISEKQMPAFIQTTLDLAAATGQDATSAARLLAQSYDDPVSALGRFNKLGLRVTDDVKAQMTAMQKAGDTAGAFALLMDRLGVATGGAAAAQAATLGGELDILKNHLEDAGRSIMLAFLPAAHELFANVIEPAIPIVEAFATKAGGAISDFTSILKYGGDPLGAFAIAMNTHFGPGVGGPLLAFVANLKTGFAFLKAMFSGDTKSFFGGLDQMGAQLSGLWVKIQPVLQQFMAQAQAWIISQLPVWQAAISQWAEAFSDWIGPQLPGIFASLGFLVGSVVGWLLADGIPKLVTGVGQMLGAVWDWVTGKGGADAATASGGLANSFSSGFIQGLAPFAGKISDIVTQATNTVRMLLTIAWAVITEALKRAWMTIVLTATVVWAGITEVFKRAGDTVKMLFDLAWAYVSNAVKTFAVSIMGDFNTLVMNIQGAFAIDWGAIGGSIIDGIKAGVTSAAQGLAQAAADAAKAALDAAKNALGIHSPSTAFMEVGVNMMAGLSQGITQNAGGPAGAMNAASGQMLRSVSTTNVTTNNYSYNQHISASTPARLGDFAMLRAATRGL